MAAESRRGTLRLSTQLGTGLCLTLPSVLSQVHRSPASVVLCALHLGVLDLDLGLADFISSQSHYVEFVASLLATL